MSLPSHSGLYRVIDNYYYACNKEYSHNKGGGGCDQGGLKISLHIGGGGGGGGRAEVDHCPSSSNHTIGCGWLPVSTHTSINLGTIPIDIACWDWWVTA